MKAIAKGYITNREYSVEEAVYLIMRELWLRKIFPQVIFLNSNLPEKRFRIFKRKLRFVSYQVIATTFFSAICLITIWIGQTKILSIVNINLLINFVLQDFYHYSILMLSN